MKKDTSRITPEPDWYKDAIIYQLHIKSFFDANNDGVGDFAGLIARLDYLFELGVTAVWLLPFYPSPRRDDGYDIANYRDVHSDYGAIADVKRFIREAHARNIRVITELVINHTSDQHPWFQAARKAKPGSPAREFYVWSDNDRKYDGTRIIFIDTEKSNWTWDEEAKAYFWHRFYSHQPDLNFDNPAVLKAVLSAMRFWLDMGIDGLRLDAVPYLIEREGTNNENLPETHGILKQIRKVIDDQYPDRMLLAEANQWPEDTQHYFGDGDECHMAFHFPLMPRMYMAIAQEDRFPITDILRQTPEIPENCQWAIFLRNHDELTLEMVTDAERDYLWQVYASDKRARLNLGIRRRLSPLLQHDRRRIELMNSLLLTMPGTPVIYYGDEIGMGDNLHLGDRDGVRTPMQWSSDRNGGFSRADPAALTLPVIMDPLYGFQAVNVEAQWQDTHSLLNWHRRMIVERRKHRSLGRGVMRLLAPRNRKVLAYLREFEGESILCIANVSRTAQAVELDLSEFLDRTPVELSGGEAFPKIGQLPYLLSLPPYGFYWFLLSQDAMPPAWSTATARSLSELHTFVLQSGLVDLESARARAVLEQDVLPGYLATQPWARDSSDNPVAFSIVDIATVPGAEDGALHLELAAGPAEDADRIRMPLAIVWEGQGSAADMQPALARVRSGRRVGVLVDALSSRRFMHGLLAGIRADNAVRLGHRDMRVMPTAAVGGLKVDEAAPITEIIDEADRTIVTVGEQATVTFFRHCRETPRAGIELARHLSDAGFAGSRTLYSEIVSLDGDGKPSSVALVESYLRHQGDGWTWTLDQLARILDEAASGAVSPDQPNIDTCEAFAEAIGRRVGEMHEIVARPSDDPAFLPSAIDIDCARKLAEEVIADLDSVLALEGKVSEASDVGALLRRLLEGRGKFAARSAEVAKALVGTVSIRLHGDLSLARFVLSNGDAVIGDMLGDPGVAAEERKGSPVKDIAGMLSSFEAAASEGAARSRHLIGSQGDMQAATLLERYVLESQRAFLRGYRQSLSIALPADVAGTARIFQARALSEAMARELRAGTMPDAAAVLRLLVAVESFDHAESGS